MNAHGRAALPLLVVGAAMVAAAVLPSVGAQAGTQSVSLTAPTRTAATVAATHRATPAATGTRRVHPSTAHRTATSTPRPTKTATHAPAPAVTAKATASRTASAPTPTHTAQPVAPKPVHTSAPHVAAHTSPTGWAALDAAIARIPTYHAGAARWVISTKFGHWGTADWYHATMYIAPGVPSDQLYNVAVHEWSHELSVLDYDGDVAAATRAMNLAFGGTGLVGAERAADCMSRLQGATWTHYTSCTDPTWRAAAAKLVAGHRL